MKHLLTFAAAYVVVAMGLGVAIGRHLRSRQRNALSDDFYGPPPGARCLLCPPDDQDLGDEDLMDHLRLHHPEQWGDGPDRWPDGRPVVVDRTLDPRDFLGGERR